MHPAKQLQFWRIDQAARRIAHASVIDIRMNNLTGDNRLIWAKRQ
jgi:hypothetical protein